MLGVTPKRSDDVDLVRPLTDYIKSNFSKPEVWHGLTLETMLPRYPIDDTWVAVRVLVVQAQQLSETIASINSTRQRVNSVGAAVLSSTSCIHTHTCMPCPNSGCVEV